MTEDEASLPVRRSPEYRDVDGRSNYNIHGDGYRGANRTITYKKGRMTSFDEGEIVAAFDGYHGWFWRNREDMSVTFQMTVSGQYIQLKRKK